LNEQRREVEVHDAYVFGIGAAKSRFLFILELNNRQKGALIQLTVDGYVHFCGTYK